MSENLRILGKYSAAMDSGDTEAVFEFWSDDFVSHVTERVSPGTRGHRRPRRRADLVATGAVRVPGHDLHRRTCSSSPTISSSRTGR